ncbi:MAG: MT-A70 family methyltransferase [Pirellulaceae bacterium]
MNEQLPSIVESLEELVSTESKFGTVYADPPWSYSNKAARGAADNHYSTMDLESICSEPVGLLVANNAHLHLWTTNAFLREAFDVMDAWGFQFKSCLIWIKPQLGMGNYWRVSHEFLLLGVRGNLPFADKTCRSWLLHRRTRHSRKPFAVRELIERVSPGPYLELYGREEHPRTQWTVYDNQVERRLF